MKPKGSKLTRAITFSFNQNQICFLKDLNETRAASNILIIFFSIITDSIPSRIDCTTHACKRP